MIEIPYEKMDFHLSNEYHSKNLALVYFSIQDVKLNVEYVMFMLGWRIAHHILKYG